MDPPLETSYYDVPYNYESIMHYGKTYFTKNGKPTIDPVSDVQKPVLGIGDDIGQRDLISTGDAQMLNAKYNCKSLLIIILLLGNEQLTSLIVWEFNLRQVQA